MKFKYSFLTMVMFSLFAGGCADNYDGENNIDENRDNTRKDIVLTRSQQEIVESQAEFSFDFFKRASEYAGKTDNIVISPLSLSLSLAMLANGADEATYNDIASVMRLSDADPDEINEVYIKLVSEILKADSQVDLSLANGMWINESLEIKDEFKKIINENYNVNMQSFGPGNLETATKSINDWASLHTNGKITNLLGDRDLSQEDIFILANALYFKGKWSKPFDKERTTLSEFMNADNSKRNVETMKGNIRDYRYAATDKAEIVQLPYGNHAFSMYIIIPEINVASQHYSEKLDEFVANLDFAWWKNSKNVMQDRPVDLRIPKFNIESKYEMIGASFFQEMSPIVFFPQLNKMMANDDSKIAFLKINQTNAIEVTEEGSEAASTSIINAVGGSYGDPYELNVNRPFIYLIEEQSTGAILFMGRVVKL